MRRHAHLPGRCFDQLRLAQGLLCSWFPLLLRHAHWLFVGLVLSLAWPAQASRWRNHVKNRRAQTRPGKRVAIRISVFEKRSATSQLARHVAVTIPQKSNGGPAKFLSSSILTGQKTRSGQLSARHRVQLLSGHKTTGVVSPPIGEEAPIAFEASDSMSGVDRELIVTLPRLALPGGVGASVTAVLHGAPSGQLPIRHWTPFVDVAMDHAGDALPAFDMLSRPFRIGEDLAPLRALIHTATPTDGWWFTETGYGFKKSATRATLALPLYAGAGNNIFIHNKSFALTAAVSVTRLAKSRKRE